MKSENLVKLIGFGFMVMAAAGIWTVLEVNGAIVRLDNDIRELQINYNNLRESHLDMKRAVCSHEGFECKSNELELEGDDRLLGRASGSIVE